MFRRFRTIVAVAAVTVTVAGASSAQEFCDLRDMELMEQLRGSWTVTHFPGMSFIPVLGATPFPPPGGPPVEDGTFIIDEILPEFDGAIAKGLQGEEMFIWNEQSYDSVFIDSLAAGSTRNPGGCAAARGPTITGANFVDFYRGTSTANSEIFLTCVVEILALTSLIYDVARESGAEPKLNKDTAGALKSGVNKCSNDLAIEGDVIEGGIWMYIAATFTSPNAGSGVLYFEGSSSGYPFYAMTPIVLTR